MKKKIILVLLAVAASVPLAIHNIGSGTQEEDVLFAYPLIGHYRIP